jgi:hypothetical protein
MVDGERRRGYAASGWRRLILGATNLVQGASAAAAGQGTVAVSSVSASAGDATRTCGMPSVLLNILDQKH